jgi:predicted flap endonuclease-1-like 5' DNA nuclease
MNKILKAISIGTGIAVATWALRDRLVRIPEPVDAKHPQFRTNHAPAHESETDHDGDIDDFTSIHGVGPVYARRLVESGIASFSEFFKTPSGSLEEITGASGDKVSHWLEQADSPNT